MIDSYNKLMLGQYREILDINQDEFLDEIEKQVKTIAILSGIPEDEILHLPLHQYKEMAATARFLESPEVPLHRMAKKYKVGDFELYPVTDFRKLGVGQYIDFHTYAADMDKYMVELISVLLVPKGMRYNEGYDILEVQKAIREGMCVTDGVTIVGFFLTLCQKSIVDSLSYCRQEAMRIKDKTKREQILAQIEMQERIIAGSGVGSQT